MWGFIAFICLLAGYLLFYMLGYWDGKKVGETEAKWKIRDEMLLVGKPPCGLDGKEID